MLCPKTRQKKARRSRSRLFPRRCAATLSFPRFALSDGRQLFVADGGNDRVLIFNDMPTTNGVRADTVLGQPDFESLVESDGASDLRAPSSLAYDGENLYRSRSLRSSRPSFHARRRSHHGEWPAKRRQFRSARHG